MLVLTRRTGETIVITTPAGERIVVTLVDVRGGNKVRIGVEALDGVSIHRGEIQEIVDHEQYEKAGGP